MNSTDVLKELELFISSEGLNFNDSIEYLIEKLEEKSGENK